MSEQTYTVTFTLSVTADNAQEAAQYALDDLRPPLAGREVGEDAGAADRRKKKGRQGQEPVGARRGRLLQVAQGQRRSVGAALVEASVYNGGKSSLEDVGGLDMMIMIEE